MKTTNTEKEFYEVTLHTSKENKILKVFKYEKSALKYANKIVLKERNVLLTKSYRKWVIINSVLENQNGIYSKEKLHPQFSCGRLVNDIFFETV